MYRKFSQEWIAGAFVQKAGVAGNPVSSLTGITAASLTTLRDAVITNAASLASLTPSSLTGAAGYRGIATINSGTTVVSVAATAAVSGAVILTSIIQYTGDRTAPNTWGQIPLTAVESVRAGAFEIVCVGSYAPVQNMPVAWFIIR